MINFETGSVFIETKPGMAFTAGNICVTIQVLPKGSLFSFQLGIWSILSNLISNIGIDCALTNLDDNGVNIDSAKDLPLVTFLH